MKKLYLFFIISCFWGFGFSQKSISLVKPYAFEWKNQPQANWSFLKGVLQDKKIVALGESLHGVKEYSAIKLELIQYLHEELGFNVLAMECDMGSMTIGGWYRACFSDTLFLEKTFSPVWHTATNLQLVNYLKENPKLQLIGFDTQQHFSSDEFLQTEIDNCIPIEEINERADFQKIKNYLIHLKETYSEIELMNKRDSLMASNLSWLMTNFYENEKVIVWAANAHISKVKISPYAFMGEILSKEYGNELYALGLFHSIGNPTHVYRDYFYENKYGALPKASLEYKLLKWKADHLFIDFKNLKQTKKTVWLEERVNQIIEINKPMTTINLSESFDGVIWIKEVTHPEYVIESDWHYLKNK